MITLYGIKNCDTVKKARKWLDEHAIDYAFHDLRGDGLTQEQVSEWVAELGWETLVNKRSTSWKALDESDREQHGQRLAQAAIMAQPTLIKRPLLDTGHQRFTGFSAATTRRFLINTPCKQGRKPARIYHDRQRICFWPGRGHP